MAKQKLSAAIRDVGPVLSRKEAAQVAKQTGKSVDQVLSKALDVGIGLGSAVVNTYQPAPFSNYVGPQYSNLTPLTGLSIPQGTAYYGATSTTTPGITGNKWNGGSSSPATTTYTPIVLPRNNPAVATGGSNSSGAGNNGGNGNGNGNTNDPYQDLRDQIDAAKQAINDIQNQQVSPYPDMAAIMAGQQASQDAFAAQAAQQQEALQALMIQQQQAYESQMAQAQQQQQAMAAQSAEALRQALAAKNAYVPGLEPTASSPSFGDGRGRGRGRNAMANTLSNLAILTGTGMSRGVTATPAGSAAPLAGLQIA